MEKDALRDVIGLGVVMMVIGAAGLWSMLLGA